MAQVDAPEQLLDVFKAAALSVTKLYKTSALAESRARSDGYQDCIEDLLSFLDREDIGLCDGEGWRIRRWATERLDGQPPKTQTTESEDETDKRERTTSPEMTRSVPELPQPQPQAKVDTTPPSPEVEEPYRFTVPSQENFTFESSHQYPNIATLDLSDSRSHEGGSFSSARSAKARFNGNSSKSSLRPGANLGRGAGSKRRMDFDDFFGGLMGGKDPFTGSSKRSRHT